MAKKTVKLSNGREWPTQTAAEAHFRAIRDRCPPKTPIDDPEDHDDLAALLERYDAAILDAVSKIGVGIGHFEVRNNYVNGGSTKGFWVVRTDGSETDFSFPYAIRGQPKPEAQEFADACRAAVAEDLQRAKKQYFDDHGDPDGRAPCDLTGTWLTVEEAHLDHAYPKFGQLVVAFRAMRGWHQEIPQGVLTQAQDRQMTAAFANPVIAEEFREFHRRAATVRVVAKGKNLAMAAEGRRPKIQRPVVL